MGYSSPDLHVSLRVARQQLSFARQHLVGAVSSKTLPARRASMQASIMSLQHGLVAYLRQVFGLDKAYALAECRLMCLTCEIDEPESPMALARSEFINLWGCETSWLKQLEAACESCFHLGSARSFDGPALITTSAISTNTHWTDISVDQIERWLDDITLLLDRQGAQYQEY